MHDEMKQQKYQKMKKSIFIQSWIDTFSKKRLQTMLLDLLLLVFLVLSIFITSIIVNDAAKDFEDIYPSLLQMGQMTAQQTPEKLKELPLDDVQKTMGAIKVKLVISFIVFVLLTCLGVSFSKGFMWSERFGLSGNKFNALYFRQFLALNLSWIGLFAVLSLLALFLMNLPYNVLMILIFAILFIYFTPALYSNFTPGKSTNAVLTNIKNLQQGLRIKSLLLFIIKIAVFLPVLVIAALSFYLALAGLLISLILFLSYFNWSRNYQKLVFEQMKDKQKTKKNKKNKECEKKR